MKLFSYLAFLCFLEISGAFVLELFLDPKSPLNRAGAASSLFYAFWSFCMIFVYGASESVALLFSHLYYLGSLFVTPALMWFYLTIAGLKPRTRLLLCLPPCLFASFVYGDFLWHGFYFESFRPGPWGNIGVPGPNRFWGDLAPLISFLEILVSLGFLLWARFRSPSRRLKHQIHILVLSVLITFGLYFLFWLAEVRFDWPDPTVLCGPYLVTATFFLIVRYRFLQKDYPLLERHTAATVQDAALLVDDKRCILGANPAALVRFGVPESELVGRDFAALITGTRTVLREWEAAAAGKPLHRWVPCQAMGRGVLVSLTARYDVFGEFVGAVVLVGDLHHFDAAATQAGLTEREKEIVLLLLQGIGPNEGADLLSISVGTIRRHIHNVYEKTGAANSVQLFNRLLSAAAR